MKMTLAEIRGWTLAAIVARHELAGGEYDIESGEFFPPPEQEETGE
jgi:hypothetical protein